MRVRNSRRFSGGKVLGYGRCRSFEGGMHGASVALSDKTNKYVGLITITILRTW